jgi:hypothetical protein
LSRDRRRRRVQEAAPEARRRLAAAGREDLALALVHQARLDRIAVVVADQMEHAVSDEQVELGREGHVDLARLTPGRLGRDHDLPDEWARPGCLEWEGQDIRAPVDAAVQPVETLDRRIVHDEHVDVSRRAAHGGQSATGGPGEPRRRHRHAVLAIGDCCWHQGCAGADPRSPLRASCAS